MLTLTILICATATLPIDCTERSALDIIRGPQVMPFACMLGSETMTARTVFAAGDFYQKAVCRRGDDAR